MDKLTTKKFQTIVKSIFFSTNKKIRLFIFSHTIIIPPSFTYAKTSKKQFYFSENKLLQENNSGNFSSIFPIKKDEKEAVFRWELRKITAIMQSVELKEPHEYKPEWKKWDLNLLPMMLEIACGIKK